MARTKPSSPVILIQCIRVWWTKKSRGAPAASQRNRIADVLNFPLPKIASQKCYVQHVVFDEPSDFDHNEKLEKYSEVPSNIWCAAFEADWPRSINVNFKYDYARAAMPPRKTMHAFSVQSGEWGQLMYNGRFTDMDTGHHYYDKFTVNIGLFDQPSADVFLKSRPNHLLSKMAKLF